MRLGWRCTMAVWKLAVMAFATLTGMALYHGGAVAVVVRLMRGGGGVAGSKEEE
jgi:hypothetical protein